MYVKKPNLFFASVFAKKGTRIALLSFNFPVYIIVSNTSV
jgi:hypothetical protein